MIKLALSTRHVSLLEAKMNAKLEETNSLLREILKREHKPKRRQLTHQKETLNEEEHSDPAYSQVDEYYSLLASSDQARAGTSGLLSSPAGSSGGRVINLASRLVPRPVLRAARSVTETSTCPHDSPREYSELTMTLDYEELKSSTLSTDDEDTTNTRDGTSLRLNIMNSTSTASGTLNRALSLQLPEPEPSEVNRGVLRQTHSDSKDPDDPSATQV